MTAARVVSSGMWPGGGLGPGHRVGPGGSVGPGHRYHRRVRSTFDR
ncbi:MAG TPA: hypothetical protein VFK38_03735 [Candidatus Limnocylindrales bacterium]|nr:hypothetical protein [Candidatus Limnocylindrales bacterium]